MHQILLIFVTSFFAVLKVLGVALGGYVLAKQGILHAQASKDFGKVLPTY